MSRPWRCVRGRKSAGRIVQVMRVLAWVRETVQGSARRSARLVSARPSYSHSHASWEASGSSAGEIVRSATATHLSAYGAE
jgi:hypothetical protein